MDFADVVRRRRMVRCYDPSAEVDRGALDRILYVATRAPSAGFTQAVEFLVLASAGQRDRFWRTQLADPPDSPDPTDPRGSPDPRESPWLAGLRTAPVLIVVTTSEAAYRARYAEADKSRARGPDRSWTAPYWDVDAGMSTMLILLAAVDEGLGACFFGLNGPEAERRLVAEFAVPDERHCVGVVSIGHPVDSAPAAGSPTRRARRPVDESVHHGSW